MAKTVKCYFCKKDLKKGKSAKEPLFDTLAKILLWRYYKPVEKICQRILTHF